MSDGSVKVKSSFSRDRNTVLTSDNALDLFLDIFLIAKAGI